MFNNERPKHRRTTLRNGGHGRCLMEPVEGRTMLSGTLQIADLTTVAIDPAPAATATSGRIGGVAVDPSDPSGNTATAPTDKFATTSTATSATKWKPLFAFTA